jgi:hypothetical protein
VLLQRRHRSSGKSLPLGSICAEAPIWGFNIGTKLLLWVNLNQSNIFGASKIKKEKDSR